MPLGVLPPGDAGSEAFSREVAERFGVLPNFFRSAAAAPGLIDRLWDFAKSAYLDSPLPSLFKERLFVHLSRFCPVRYCIIRHLGFLTGFGRPAGDPLAAPQTTEQGMALLRRPVPDAAAFELALARLEHYADPVAIPAPETPLESDLFDVLTILFLAPLGSGRARQAVQAALGEEKLEFLIAFLAFIRTAHFWTETHPDLDCEPDMIKLMNHNAELARLLLDPTDADWTRGEVERAKALSSLRESELRFYAVADLVPDLLWGGDPSGRTTWINRRWLDYTGTSFEDARAAGWMEAIHPDDRADSAKTFQDAIAAGLSFQQEHRIRAHDGAFRWFLMRGEPVRDAAGRVAEWFGSATDIDDQKRAQERLREVNKTLEQRVVERTVALQSALDALEAETAERNKAEAALRQSQKMEAVGQLTGGIAHDFNNLLTGIIGSLDLLTLRLAQGRLLDLHRYIGTARGAADRAAALTQRLLAFARRQTLDPKPTLANQQVAEMEDLIRRTIGPSIALKTILAPGLWSTLCDPNQLGNALLNLCVNARDAMAEGGRLTVETANAEFDRPTARGLDLAPGQYVTIAVSDTGAGMPPDVLVRAFDPFFTTKPLGQGTGLGLSMIYGFAQQSGGQVRIDSIVGQGTIVRLYLPRILAVPEDEAASLVPSDPPRPEQGQTVLVVDDEPAVRMVVMEVLEELGYSAIEAANGTAALKVLRSDTRIDLLVTDIGLPGGMNGRQLAEAARQARPALKVLFVTGFANKGVPEGAPLEAGMETMSKPFTMEALTARITGILVGE